MSKHDLKDAQQALRNIEEFLPFVRDIDGQDALDEVESAHGALWRTFFDDEHIVLVLSRDEAEAVAIALKLANRSWNFEYDVTHRRIERPAYRHVIAAETAERELKDVLAEIGAVV